ncbi:hypothetical protein P3T35_001304 [Kitasatospora sp. GP30]|nr:hypothetical protein [Kitasatospora sp. GP30]
MDGAEDLIIQGGEVDDPEALVFLQLPTRDP